MSPGPGPGPGRLFRGVAVAEAVTWALLLAGMFLKYVTQTTELGVRVFGMLHGVVFVTYCVTTVVVAVDQRWRAGRTLLGLVAAVPPFASVLFHRHAVRRDALAPAWRLAGDPARTPLELAVAWLLAHPMRGLLAGAVGVAALTGVALLVGPPAG